MIPSKVHYFPLTRLFIVLLFLLLGLIIAMIEIGVLRYAYEKIGIHRHYVFGLLLVSLLGSYVNIPLTELPAERVLSNRRLTWLRYGTQYYTRRARLQRDSRRPAAALRYIVCRR